MALIARLRSIVVGMTRGDISPPPLPPSGTRYLALGANRLALNTSRLVING